jgi:hypothetical protein
MSSLASWPTASGVRVPVRENYAHLALEVDVACHDADFHLPGEMTPGRLGLNERANRPKAEGQGHRRGNRFVSLMEFHRDGSQAKRHQKEVKCVQGPAQKTSQ